jgi:hypothetical protein
MNTDRHCKIVKDMDDRIMTGERISPELVMVLTALRDLVDQSHDYNRKMSDRVNAMKTQVDSLRWAKDKMTERMDAEKSIREQFHRECKEMVSVANRRAGIWKAKVERLKAQGEK